MAGHWHLAPLLAVTNTLVGMVCSMTRSSKKSQQALLGEEYEQWARAEGLIKSPPAWQEREQMRCDLEYYAEGLRDGIESLGTLVAALHKQQDKRFDVAVDALIRVIASATPKWGGRPIGVKVHGSVLHAMSRSGYERPGVPSRA
jgi:hypothetical protein